MILVSPECVLRLMGVNSSIGETLESVEQILHVVTEALSGSLDTPLHYNERRDYFNYLPSKYETGYTPQLLILTQGFLQNAPVVTSSGVVLTEGTDYTVSKKYGTVRLLSQPTRGYSTVDVVYSAGFTGEQDVNIPGWLAAAAQKEAVSQIQSTQIGYNKKELRDKSGFLDRAAKRMLDDHTRPRVGLHPESSDIL